MNIVGVFLTVMGPILYILLPALTFSVMAKSDLGAREFTSLVACAWLVAILQAGIAAFVSRRLAFDHAEEGGNAGSPSRRPPRRRAGGAWKRPGASSGICDARRAVARRYDVICL